MKTTLQCALLGLALTPGVAMAQVFDARSMGRAGTGITFGDYNQALTNPALINNVREGDDFAFGVNAGAIASDQDEAIDTIERIQEDVDELEQRCLSNPLACDSSDADPIRNKMGVIDEQLIQVDGGGAALVGVPVSGLRIAVTAESSARVGAQFDLDRGDITGSGVSDPANPPDPDGQNNDTGGVLEDISEGQATEDDLASSVAASAVRRDEFSAVVGGKALEDYAWGAQIKLQKLELLDYNVRIADAASADVLDASNSEEHDSANLDLGFRRQPADSGFSYGATVTNAIPQSFEGPRRVDFEQEPQLNIAGGWQTSWLKSEASVEVNEAPGFAILEDTRFARAGLELSAGQHAHLRLGYRKDLQDNVADLVSAGVGISPFDTVSLDLAGMVGDGDTYGGALQLGLKF